MRNFEFSFDVGLELRGRQALGCNEGDEGNFRFSENYWLSEEHVDGVLITKGHEGLTLETGTKQGF